MKIKRKSRPEAQSIPVHRVLRPMSSGAGSSDELDREKCELSLCRKGPSSLRTQGYHRDTGYKNTPLLHDKSG